MDKFWGDKESRNIGTKKAKIAQLTYCLGNVGVGSFLSHIPHNLGPLCPPPLQFYCKVCRVSDCGPLLFKLLLKVSAKTSTTFVTKSVHQIEIYKHNEQLENMPNRWT